MHPLSAGSYPLRSWRISPIAANQPLASQKYHLKFFGNLRGDLLFEISNQIRETRLSPRQAPRRSLLPLSPKRTQVRLKSLLCLVWLAPDSFRTHGRPPVQECRLRLKRPPSSSRTLARHLPFKSSTAARSCSYSLFTWAALLRFAFGQKIWHTIFFSSKPNFKIFPKLLPKPRGASQSPKSWHVTVYPRYPAWSF